MKRGPIPRLWSSIRISTITHQLFLQELHIDQKIEVITDLGFWTSEAIDVVRIFANENFQIFTILEFWKLRNNKNNWNCEIMSSSWKGIIK